MADRLRLSSSDVLYRTRGHDWDYAFLLQPEPLLVEGWYTLHRRIFSNIEPEPTPVLLRGALGIGVGQPFLATAFTDAVRRDYQARPVAHYLTWLGKNAEAAPMLSFGPALIEALSPALDAVFGLAPETLKRGQNKPLDALLQERFLAALPAGELDVEGSAPSAIQWLGTIAP
jgi:hypothetical protein